MAIKIQVGVCCPIKNDTCWKYETGSLRRDFNTICHKPILFEFYNMTNVYADFQIVAVCDE